MARAAPGPARLGKLAFVQSRFDTDVAWRRFTDEVLGTHVWPFTDLRPAAPPRTDARSLVKRRAGPLTTPTP